MMDIYSKIFDKFYKLVDQHCDLDKVTIRIGKSLDGVWSKEFVFKDSATPEEIAAVNAVAFDFAAEEVKQDTFNAAIASGFPTGLGWNLPLDEESRIQLDQLRNNLMTGIARNKITYDTPCPVKLTDTNGNLHQLTVGEVVDLIFYGGVYYGAKYDEAR